MELHEFERKRRRYLLPWGLISGLLALCSPAALDVSAPPDFIAPVAAMQTGDNPIVAENQQPGSAGWVWSRPGDDVTGQIKGYASATSVRQTDSISFHVSVNPAQTFTIDFYRIGWYGGAGGRFRLRAGPLSATQQPSCPTDANTGMIACNWAPAYTLTVPTDWTSGVYFALLTNAEGFQNYVVFVVRDNRPAAFLFQHSVATDHAYNNYPNDSRTGKSLYGFNSYGANTVAGTPQAVKVSFDRPLADSGLGNFMYWPINLVRWLERSGYDVTYSTNIDTHANGAELRRHRAFFSTPHDEYWSKETFDAVEAARDNGVNLAFFGGDSVVWQVRYEPSAAGTPNRVMVCYRNLPWFPIDPVQGPTTTTYWRYPPLNRPEQSLVGVIAMLVTPNVNYIVTNASHWLYSGTGFVDGDVVPGIVGYEADTYVASYGAPNSANHTLLARSPVPNPENGITYYANSSIYQAPSGAWVFASGTMSWSWALDDVPGPAAKFRVDPRIQRTTANLLDAFLNGAPATNNPLITSFTPARPPVGGTIAISGANLSGATGVRLNGSAAPFTVLSDTSIQATVPDSATAGPISVTTPAGTASSANDLTIARPPTITSFMPAGGQAGTRITIHGSSFTGTTGVTFTGASVTRVFQVISDDAVQVIVPNGALTGPVSVTNAEGTTTSGNRFTVAGTPTIASFVPTSGPAGTSVAINGTNFTGTTAVRFNGTTAPFTVTSDTAIQTTVPAGATTGPLSVTTSTGTVTSTNAFTIASSAPTIAGFTPTSGPVGTTVTISGTNFTGATAVRFNGTAAAFSIASDTAIQTTVPAGASTGPVSVTTPAGTANSSAATFTVTVPPQPPTIAGFTPASGPIGTSVTITGTNFTGTTAVRFNGTAATFTVVASSSLQATVPAGATSGPLSVTTSDGAATSATNFTVIPPPAITSFTPATGPVGISVSISGTNFTGATTARFNGTAATFTVISATAIEATVPAGATSGPLSVTTSGGTATSVSTFAVIPPPVLTSFMPTSGPAGTSVTISGTNFSGATAVRFNGTAATFTVTSATAIQTAVPGGATTGLISVTTPGGIATSPTSFTVTPTITSFTPTSGLVDAAVTVNGTNLAGTTAVAFNGVAASFTVTSATSLRATVPAGARTGPIRVTTPDGTATSSTSFTVRHTLTVTKTGVLGGTVTSSPPGINCGSTCSAAFDSDQVVTLTATPTLFSLFTGWSGCDSVSGNSCTVAMSRARTVSARFLP